MKKEFYYKDDDKNMIAVLYSEGYGLGWSTEAKKQHNAFFMATDKTLVEMAIRGANYTEVGEYLYQYIDERIFHISHRWERMVYEFVHINDEFRITEYDGFEGIEVNSNSLWFNFK